MRVAHEPLCRPENWKTCSRRFGLHGLYSHSVPKLASIVPFLHFFLSPFKKVLAIFFRLVQFNQIAFKLTLFNRLRQLVYPSLICSSPATLDLLFNITNLSLITKVLMHYPTWVKWPHCLFFSFCFGSPANTIN